MSALSLGSAPAELDPLFHAPRDEKIEEMVRGRRARLGEWVNCYRMSANGHHGDVLLGRVAELRDDGYFVLIWDRASQGFTEQFFAPHSSILSRTQVNYYSLTGRWHEALARERK